MKKPTKVDVSEQELEDLVRQYAGDIEEGLTYVDHQKSTTSGRLDALMVDSGKSLVVAELKVVPDDAMLLQGLDYYDYVSEHVEAYARLYKSHSIDPTQQVRLLLIAPTFSQTLVNRCKWLNVPVSLFTFSCLKFDGDPSPFPIFTETRFSAPPPVIESSNLEDHLSYITDLTVRAKVAALLEEMKSWKPGSIAVDPGKNAISVKVRGRVFAYVGTRRKHYIIATYNADDEWTGYPIKGDDDLAKITPIMKAAMESRAK